PARILEPHSAVLRDCSCDSRVAQYSRSEASSACSFLTKDSRRFTSMRNFCTSCVFPAGARIPPEGAGAGGIDRGAAIEGEGNGDPLEKESAAPSKNLLSGLAVPALAG